MGYALTCVSSCLKTAWGVVSQNPRSADFSLTAPDWENPRSFRFALTAAAPTILGVHREPLLYPQGVQGPGQAPGGAARRSRRLLGTGWADPRSRILPNQHHPSFLGSFGAFAMLTTVYPLKRDSQPKSGFLLP